MARVRHVLTRVCCITVCELCYLCATLRDSCIDVSYLIILCDLASMPRLSDSDRNRIIGEIRAGIKPSEVALRYNVHRSAVYRLMNKFTQDGDVVDRPRSGRPRVTDAREDRAMLMEHRRNPYRSAAETARVTIRHHGRRISDRTVRRRLHAVGLFFSPPTEKAFYDGLPPPL